MAKACGSLSFAMMAAELLAIQFGAAIRSGLLRMCAGGQLPGHISNGHGSYERSRRGDAQESYRWKWGMGLEQENAGDSAATPFC